jgi:hypothetical protein
MQMNWIKNQKTKTKILLSLLFSSAIIFLIGVVGIQSLRQANESDIQLFEKIRFHFHSAANYQPHFNGKEQIFWKSFSQRM